MSIIGSNILAGASGQGGDYTIARSLRFRSSASAYLNRTPASAGNRKTFTFSAWVKRGILGSDRELISVGSGSALYCGLRFTTTDKFDICLDDSNYRNRTTQVFRDTSAWYHIVIAIDTTQSTSSNRVKMYVNGSQVTAFDTALYPTQNYDTQFNNTTAHNIGRRTEDSAAYLDGYMTEVNFIDGQALTPSSFGENNADTGVWQPKRYAGTYGTNGFYLPFTDNSALTSGSNAGLGKDFSGNGNYWNTNNISITSGSTYDSMTDVPTLTSATASNFAVLNPLASAGTFSNANLNLAVGSTAESSGLATMALPSTGKYYWEVLVTAVGFEIMIGIYDGQSTTNPVSGGAVYLYRNFGQKYDGSLTSYGSTYTTNDVIGVAIDMSGGTITFYKNGVSQGQAFSGISGSNFRPTNYLYDNASIAINFGQRPFAYTPPTGFVALNTFNLPTPTIGATASTQANKYMDATLYTGTAATQTVTNAGGFQPDLVWVKIRSDAGTHILTDAVRGANKQLYSNLTNAEGTSTVKITGFTSTGFTLGADDGSGSGNANATVGGSYVGWQWKANGSGSSNTAGSITSTVSANTSAGFSVVTYTGNGTSGATVGHGLGVAPRMLIIKARDGAGYSWKVYHGSLGSGSHLELESTAAAQGGIWNSTNPSSTVFTLGTNAGINENGKSYVCYAFSEVAGYSKFGSYTGNGSSDGTFVYTGFRPRFIMVKRTDTTTNWIMYDTARDTYNFSTKTLYANLSSAEETNTTLTRFDLLSNGFKPRNTSSWAESNASGGTYIYMAIAENPFKYSLAR